MEGGVTHKAPQDFLVQLRGRRYRVTESLQRPQQLPRQVPRGHALEQIAHDRAP